MQLPTFKEESLLWERGVEFVIGVDEVGRGSFAGPVTAGAVIFRKRSIFEGGLLTKINDSKLLEPKIRESLSVEIKKEALCYATSTVGVSTINNVGIGKATQIAMRMAVESIMYKILSSKYRSDKFFVLIDGFNIKHIRKIGLKNQKGIIKGDRKSISIAAASIIAKVHRDGLMRKLNRKYPQYGFFQNKGYGTKFHQTAIKNHGLSDLHRTSFNLQKFL
ncbi:MAG: ribonuclease HII [Patescibacteria group bacterium]